MSIANEIQRIQGAKANIKAAIEEKGVTVGDGTIDTYAAKISEISGGGGIDWLYYASTCNNIFGGVAFPENSKITIRSKSCTNFGYMFNNTTNIKSIKMISDTVDSIVDMSRFCNTAYNNLKTLEMVDFTEFHKKFKDIFNIFYNQFNLKTVLGAMDLTNCTAVTNAFSSCSALEDVEFEKGTIKISISFANCSLLTDISIQSIIDGLADLTGGTAQTLTLHATVGAKLTETQKATITAKNWKLVY